MWKQPLVIGFGHKARQGKDMAIEAILAARNERGVIRRVSFADALKKEVNRLAGKVGGMEYLVEFAKTKGIPTFNDTPRVAPDWVKFDPDAPMDDPLCKLGKQRLLLQWWGTELRRADNPFYWVKKVHDEIGLDKKHSIFLIPDLRFYSELLWIKNQMNGYTVKITREGFKIGASEHSSEKELEDAPFDYEISNPNGDIAGLKSDAVEVFDLIIDAANPIT